MKNNKGFVVSAVLYPLLILFLSLIMGLIAMSSTRKNILDNMKMEISDSIFDSVTCDCEVINSTLKKYGQSIKNIENDITAIENDINTINTTQNTLSTNLTNLTNRVTSLETNVNSLKTKMSTAESKITNIETNYATKTTTNLLDTKITNLTSTVNSINTSLTNLTTRVNTLAQSKLIIYMSPSGNDSYDGLSSSKPMKTLNAVLNKYSNNYLEISLATGTYNWGSVYVRNRDIKITAPRNQTCVNGINQCGAIINLDTIEFMNSNVYLNQLGLNFSDNYGENSLFNSGTLSPGHYIWLETEYSMSFINSTAIIYNSYNNLNKSKLVLYNSNLETSSSRYTSRENAITLMNNSTLVGSSTYISTSTDVCRTTSCADEPHLYHYATLIIDSTSKVFANYCHISAYSSNHYYLWRSGGTYTKKNGTTSTGKVSTWT